MYPQSYQVYCAFILLGFQFCIVKSTTYMQDENEVDNSFFCYKCETKKECEKTRFPSKCSADTTACMLEGNLQLSDDGEGLLTYRAVCATESYCPRKMDLMCLPTDEMNRKVCRQCCHDRKCNDFNAQKKFGLELRRVFEQDTGIKVTYTQRKPESRSSRGSDINDWQNDENQPYYGRAHNIIPGMLIGFTLFVNWLFYIEV